MIEKLKCKLCNKKFEAPHWRRQKFCSQKCSVTDQHIKQTGVPKPKEQIEKMRLKMIGKSAGEKNYFYGMHAYPKEWTEKRVASLPRGENHWNWKGGITPATEKVRKSRKHTDWSLLVRNTWNNECQICGATNTKLDANHIIKFSEDPEKRFELENGIALCRPCHKKLVNHHEDEWRSYFNFCWENKNFNQIKEKL